MYVEVYDLYMLLSKTGKGSVIPHLSSQRVPRASAASMQSVVRVGFLLVVFSHYW